MCSLLSLQGASGGGELPADLAAYKPSINGSAIEVGMADNGCSACMLRCNKLACWGLA